MLNNNATPRNIPYHVHLTFLPISSSAAQAPPYTTQVQDEGWYTIDRSQSPAPRKPCTLALGTEDGTDVDR